ncbi:MAG: exosortase system-associated protein, TIGR04073 family [Methylomicrobium sp.]
MIIFSRFFASLTLAGLAVVYTPGVMAQSTSPYPDGIDAPAPRIPTKPQSYGERVGEKAVNSFANIATGWLEMPKNVINTTNQSNIIYGFIGGLAKGMVHTAGRMGVGIADLVTLPLATKPIIYPLYIWDDFDVDTVYGEVMRLHQEPRRTEIAPPPAPQAAAPIPAAEPAPPPVQYPNDTNRKIDAIFKKEMTK